eukprot:NODE_11709_length_1269_cov_5.767075.p1 GENE.NODE_11709_length_1269_cov_5.767075~~NODE_11709_length_1269_cov_5.767075.p1  ORF type:complete len:395 (+),score=41.61 NODE_11709_length_1269_cov_5.767075:63-1247(+)
MMRYLPSSTPLYSSAASDVYTRLLPLRVALGSRASDAVIEMLLKACPGAAKERDDVYGMLPLHWAWKSQASDTVVEMLLKAHPDAARQKDGKYGMLPLHMALESQASDTVIEMLLKAFPDAAQIMCAGEFEFDEDPYCDLPLHLALGHRASDAVIEMLLKAYPGAAKEKDYVYGMLALHWASKSQASDAVIEMLLQAHPGAAKEKDYEHILPLHVALESRASDTVIEMLLKAHPDAAKGRYGRYYDILALQMALESRASDAVIEKLSGLANLSTSDIALLVHNVSARHASHGRFPRLFPIIKAGATTLGSFESVTSALMATSWLGLHSLKEGLRVFRAWHHGGKLWKMCIERTFRQFLPKLASHTISSFVCGECACELCCRPRPAAEAAPGGDQ